MRAPMQGMLANLNSKYWQTLQGEQGMGPSTPPLVALLQLLFGQLRPHLPLRRLLRLVLWQRVVVVVTSAVLVSM